MDKVLYLTGLMLVLLGCGADNKFEQRTNSDIQKKSKALTTEKKADPTIQGRIELKSFRNKYENKWENKPKVFPYSDGSSFKVYKLDCSGECANAAFTKRKSDGIEISKDAFLEFVALLKDPKSYDNSTAACFDPKFALIVYDGENVPMEFLSICLDCNNFRTYPGELELKYKNALLHGFSKETREKLRSIFLKWGIDYYGFAPLWDDEQKYLDYLKAKSK